MCTTYHSVLEGSFLLFLGSLLAQPCKYASRPSVQDEGILCAKYTTQCLCIDREAHRPHTVDRSPGVRDSYTVIGFFQGWLVMSKL